MIHNGRKLEERKQTILRNLAEEDSMAIESLIPEGEKKRNTKRACLDLETRGLVKVIPASSDDAPIMVAITPEGRELVDVTDNPNRPKPKMRRGPQPRNLTTASIMGDKTMRMTPDSLPRPFPRVHISWDAEARQIRVRPVRAGEKGQKVSGATATVGGQVHISRILREASLDIDECRGHYPCSTRDDGTVVIDLGA